ncbi:MAG: DUF1445 domain-containing protein [Alphaproteobacteria bacterium]|nr:DUF1445 domain-containing protein [Alphaproteobacteria bacterium]
MAAEDKADGRDEETQTAAPSPAPRSPTAARRLIREGLFDGPTGALAPGQVQAALAAVPAEAALAFAAFCLRNPKALPLLAMTLPGERRCPALGADVDLARDLPAYRVIEDGGVAGEVADAADLWRDDLTGFLIGTGHALDAAFAEAGLALRHRSESHPPPLFETNVPMEAAGRFSGRLWVGMRPFSPSDAVRAIEISGRYPMAHGAPVHMGEPSAIGLDRLTTPDLNPPSRVAGGETPLFWASSRSAEPALLAAGLDFALVSPPGKLLVTDLQTERARGF